MVGAISQKIIKSILIGLPIGIISGWLSLMLPPYIISIYIEFRAVGAEQEFSYITSLMAFEFLYYSIVSSVLNPEAFFLYRELSQINSEWHYIDTFLRFLNPSIIFSLCAYYIYRSSKTVHKYAFKLWRFFVFHIVVYIFWLLAFAASFSSTAYFVESDLRLAGILLSGFSGGLVGGLGTALAITIIGPLKRYQYFVYSVLGGILGAIGFVFYIDCPYDGCTVSNMEINWAGMFVLYAIWQAGMYVTISFVSPERPAPFSASLPQN